MRKSVIMMLVLGLFGWLTMGQATAQVLSSDGTQAIVSQDGSIDISATGGALPSILDLQH